MRCGHTSVSRCDKSRCIGTGATWRRVVRVRLVRVFFGFSQMRGQGLHGGRAIVQLGFADEAGAVLANGEQGGLRRRVQVTIRRDRGDVDGVDGAIVSPDPLVFAGESGQSAAAFSRNLRSEMRFLRLASKASTAVSMGAGVGGLSGRVCFQCTHAGIISSGSPSTLADSAKI
jgi:hypothetical protein